MTYKTAATCVAQVLVCSMFAIALLPSARADSISASCTPADCGNFTAFTFSFNSSGDIVTAAPAVGTWQAPLLGPSYSLAFTTAAPVSSNVTSFLNSVTNFNAFVSLQSDYGAGGTLQITGPGGFTFSGTFTGGTYSLGGDYTDPAGLFQGEALDMNFTGLSNDGRQWIGNLDIQETLDNGSEDGGFTMQTPEPASMALLGGGALLIWLRKTKHR